MFSGWGVPPRVGSVRPPGWRGVVSAFGVLMRFIIFSSLCVFFCPVGDEKAEAEWRG